MGADLAPATLVDAYRQGVFPWPHDSIGTVPWFCPPRRGVLPLDRVRVSRSLARTLRRCGFETTLDEDFGAVVEGCREPRPGEDGTWISDELAAAYCELHELGHAHSLEVWDGGRLVGGIYGVLVGGVFCGESKFHRTTDASKVALIDLAARLIEARAGLLEVQHATPHLRSLGAIEIPREVYLGLLTELRDDLVQLLCDRLPVSRLLDPAAPDDLRFRRRSAPRRAPPRPPGPRRRADRAPGRRRGA